MLGVGPSIAHGQALQVDQHGLLLVFPASPRNLSAGTREQTRGPEVPAANGLNTYCTDKQVDRPLPPWAEPTCAPA